MFKRFVVGVLIAFCVVWAEASPARADLHFITQRKSNRVIVFIDGLQVDTSKSFRWGAGVGSWPELMAGDQASSPKQLALAQYDTAILSFAGTPADHASVPQLAVKGLADLKSAGVMDGYDSVIFVAHGVGGLILKSMLVQSATSGSAGLPAKAKIVFLLSAPAQGKPAADLLTVLAQHESLAMDFGALNVGVFLQGLESLWSEYLAKRGPTKRLEVYCRHETTATFGVAVAAGQYTTEGCDDSSLDPAADHQSIARPASREAGAYRWVRNHLADYFQRFPSDPALPKAATQSASAEGTTSALPANAEPVRPAEAFAPPPAPPAPPATASPPVAMSQNDMAPATTSASGEAPGVEPAEHHPGRGFLALPAWHPVLPGDWSFALKGKDCNLAQQLWVVQIHDQRLNSDGWNTKIGRDGRFTVNTSSACATELVRGRVSGKLGTGTYLYADPCSATYCRVRFKMAWRKPIEGAPPGVTRETCPSMVRRDNQSRRFSPC